MTFKKCFFSSCLAAGFFFAVSCANEEKKIQEYELKIDSLATALDQQRRMSDSLNTLLKQDSTASDLSVFFGKGFENIQNPEEYIATELEKLPEKIPLDAVLGGKMEFRQVKVLTDDWVLAFYDDGHVQGKSIYRYEIQPDGDLKFREVASSLPK